MRSASQMPRAGARQGGRAGMCRGGAISRTRLSVACTMAPERPFSSQINSPDIPSTSQPSPTGLHGKAVEEYAMWRCIEQHQRYPRGLPVPAMRWTGNVLEDAYVRCGEVTSEYAKTFYLGTQLMTPQQAKAIWAIYVWCRRTDELVDGPNANQITPEVRMGGLPWRAGDDVGEPWLTCKSLKQSVRWWLCNAGPRPVGAPA